MRYSQRFMKYCKPIYKISGFLLRSGMVALIIGIVLGFIGKGWIVLYCAISLCVMCIIIANIPVKYLVSYLKFYDDSLTDKQAVGIAQKHLKEPIISRNDTVSFVHDIMDGFEKENRKQKN